MNTKVATTHGMFSREAEKDLVEEVEQTKRARTIPCTVWGTVCSCAKLQPKLPQVILPKYAKQASPPERMNNTFAAVGAPLEAWHKTGGWNNTVTMKLWLKRLRACVKEHDPELNIILQMDCSSVHLNMETLRCAKLLNITVVMVPARCTWVLQPLDVYVYAALKRALRRGLSRHELSSPNGNIDVLSRIAIIGQSIHEVLVGKDWAWAMERLGTGATSKLKPGVAELCEGCDTSPRLPTIDELKFNLGKFGTHGKVNWYRMLCEPVAAVYKKAPVKPQVTIPEAKAASSTSSASSGSAAVAKSVTPILATRLGYQPPAAFEAEKFVPKVVGVRLLTKRLPSATNLDVERPHTDRVGPAAGTRSEVAAKAKGTAASAGGVCTE